MIASVQAKTMKELVEKIEGTQVASGSAGTNLAGSGNLEDLTAGAFTNVLVGDTFFISGTTTVYAVSAKADANHITVTPVIAAAHTTNAKWRAKRGGYGLANILWGGPVREDGQWTIFFDSATFGV